MFFLGVHSFQGDSGKGLDPGFRLGTILGGRLNHQFSLNGELTIDVLNFSDVPSGVDVTAAIADVTLSPFLHLPLSPRAEMVLGPKLGLWAESFSTKSNGLEATGRSHGFAAGLNLGIFGAVTPRTSLGGLLSFVSRSFSERCSTPSNGSETCSSSNLPDAGKIVGFTGAVLF